MQPESLQLLKTLTIKPEEVVFIESEINYSTLHFYDGKRLTIAKTLKKIQEITQPHDFVRVNRKTLVNPAYIQRECWNLHDKHIRLINGKPIYYSRRRLTTVKKQIMTYFLN